MVIYDFRGVGSRFVQRCVMAQGRRVVAEGGTIANGKSGLNSCNRAWCSRRPVNNSGGCGRYYKRMQVGVEQNVITHGITTQKKCS